MIQDKVHKQGSQLTARQRAAVGEKRYCKNGEISPVSRLGEFRVSLTVVWFGMPPLSGSAMLVAAERLSVKRRQSKWYRGDLTNLYYCSKPSSSSGT